MTDLSEQSNLAPLNLDERTYSQRVYPKSYFTEGSTQFYCYDMGKAPLGTKLIAKNEGGVACFAVLTNRNIGEFIAWAPLPVDAPEDKGFAFSLWEKTMKKYRDKYTNNDKAN